MDLDSVTILTESTLKTPPTEYSDWNPTGQAVVYQDKEIWLESVEQTADLGPIDPSSQVEETNSLQGSAALIDSLHQDYSVDFINDIDSIVDDMTGKLTGN
jgi:hypothetical protein